ncbi:hypothetical protein DXG01_016476 [Tephrocybe rancida]|nr:hypothetical protein DXG01_016476 [Tephrocybe rancida]
MKHLGRRFAGLAGVSRADQAGSSVFWEGSIECFEDDEVEDIGINEDGGSPRPWKTAEEPVAGPSSSPLSTPVKHPRPCPAGFYLTPQSPPPPLSRRLAGICSRLKVFHAMPTWISIWMLMKRPLLDLRTVLLNPPVAQETNRVRKEADHARILALEEQAKELEETHRRALETHHTLGKANSARISVLEEQAKELKELVETHCALVLELEEGRREDGEANRTQATALQEARVCVEKLAAVLRGKEEDIENLKEELMITTQLYDDVRSAKDAAEARAETRQAHEAAIAETRAAAVARAQRNKENEKEAYRAPVRAQGLISSHSLLT